MRKPRCKSEIYNDLDSEIVNVFRVLRDAKKAKSLERLLRLTPFSREEFDEAYNVEVKDPVERARRTIVRSFMGHGADSTTRMNKSGFRGKTWQQNKAASVEWQTYFDALPAFTERLAGVLIENRDAKEVMAANDTPQTLHYIDPPYHFDSRSSGDKHGYRHEMDHDDHVELIEFLKELTGMVIVSAYRHPIYDSLGWKAVAKSTLADGAAEREEVLYLNPAAERAQAQLIFNGV